MDNGNGSSGLRTYRAEMNNADGLDRTWRSQFNTETLIMRLRPLVYKDLGNPIQFGNIINDCNRNKLNQNQVLQHVAAPDVVICVMVKAFGR